MTQLEDIVADPMTLGFADDSTPTFRPGRRVRSALSWGAYLLGTWIFLRPILLTTVFADDFINPFLQFTYSGTSPWQLTVDGWNQARGAGHINFLGQIVGGYLLTAWMLLMSGPGLRYSTIYAGSKLLVFVLVASAGATLLRRSSEALGRSISPWRARLGVSVLLFGTLQLHIPWSNDPVGSYPASGFASAAVGFLVLSTALLALQRDSFRLAVLAGLLGCASVWYYEINAAAVASVVPLLIWAWLRSTAPRRPSTRLAGFGLVMVVVPGIIVAASKVLLAPTQGTYTGTQVTLGSDQIRGILNGLASTLPATAWSLSREWLQKPVMIWTSPILILAVVATAMVALARRFPMPKWEGAAAPRLQVLMLVLCPLCYVVGSTVMQASTQKVQNEAPRVGFVYNFYAMGATGLAVIACILIVAAPRGWNRPVVRVGLGAAFITLVAVQSLINWNIAVRFNDVTAPNRQLLVAFTEGREVEERCAALTTWASGAWPDYYEQFMIDGLEDAFQYFHHEAFCPGFVRPPQ